MNRLFKFFVASFYLLFGSFGFLSSSALIEPPKNEILSYIIVFIVMYYFATSIVLLILYWIGSHFGFLDSLIYYFVVCLILYFLIELLFLEDGRSWAILTLADNILNAKDHPDVILEISCFLSLIFSMVLTHFKKAVD